MLCPVEVGGCQTHGEPAAFWGNLTRMRRLIPGLGLGCPRPPKPAAHATRLAMFLFIRSASLCGTTLARAVRLQGRREPWDPRPWRFSCFLRSGSRCEHSRKAAQPQTLRFTRVELADFAVQAPQVDTKGNQEHRVGQQRCRGDQRPPWQCVDLEHVPGARGGNREQGPGDRQCRQ